MSKTFAKQLRSPERLAEAREAIKRNTEELRNTLEALQDELEQKQGELQVLRSKPLTREALEAQARGCVSNMAPVGLPEVSNLDYGRHDLVESQLRRLSAAELLALVAPNLLVEHLMRRLDYRAEQSGGWRTEEQAGADRVREDELAVEVEELKAALQAAKRAAWQAGIQVKGFERPEPIGPNQPGVYGPGRDL